jgi:hypothetical protein
MANGPEYNKMFASPELQQASQSYLGRAVETKEAYLDKLNVLGGIPAALRAARSPEEKRIIEAALIQMLTGPKTPASGNSEIKQ